ncbi:hypothetical protein BKA61DRAFT_704103 [Leptodontidium sp. MPI-SDFR-AT-0119]|nr:hypothetical protein BKA61DRAFT_704103 [Leptodontidium sp. MPI-SDFR-AT-0119]
MSLLVALHAAIGVEGLKYDLRGFGFLSVSQLFQSTSFTMRLHNISFFCVCLSSLARTTNAAAVTPSQVSTSTRPSVGIRADTNLTSLTNATLLVQELDYTGNCSVAISWYKNLPIGGAGFGNDTLNVIFLRTTLPPQYESATDDQVAGFYDELSFGSLSDSGWIGTAKDDIETGCIAPQFERQISLANLNATQNCTATAIFLSSLGWLTGPQIYSTSSYNDSSWLEFLHAALPARYQANITELELFVYRNFFLASERADDITNLLNRGYISCKNDICEIQGYTGNPDIGGIGVMCSYSVEAALVTLYFAAINLQIWMKGADLSSENPSKIQRALEKASEGLLDGALFFSLSISSAGWVSFHSGQSYYEKLVFTSANVLALSALFAFLGIFTKEGRKKRGEWILGAMLIGILTESAIQYIVYLGEPNQRYDDYACLHAQFLDQGYHPTVFEALFFVLLGLSVLAGIVALFWLLTYKWNAFRTRTEKGVPVTQNSDGESTQKRYKTVDLWVTVTRLFIQIVALVVMWVELVYLWKIRSMMSKIAGDTWSEGSWGFGQILALFIWLPPVIDIIGWLVLPRRMLGDDEEDKCKCKLAGASHCPCSTTPGAVIEGDQKATAQENSHPVGEKAGTI